MSRFRSALLALFVAASVPMAAAGQPASTDYRPIFETVWRTVDRNFYDPTFRGVDWKGVGARYRSRLGVVRSDLAFDALVEQMLGELKVSHAFLIPPAGSAAARPSIGAKVGRVQDAWIVTTVAPLSDARLKGLRLGDRLLGTADALRGALGSEANVRVQGCDGQERRLTVRRERAFWPPAHPGWRWTTLSQNPQSSVGYLQIERFDDGAAELADQAMAEMKDTTALIIDLRGASGGNTSALRLASYFMPAGEAPAIALLSREYLEPLGRQPNEADVRRAPKVIGAYTDEAVFKSVSENGGAAAFYTETLDGRRYRKPVVILIDQDTGSAAEGFAWIMRLRTGARFLGRRTAGALLSSEQFDVGGGWKLTIPVHGLWGAEGQDFGDKAISPDLQTTWTRADYCTGRDPDLQRALVLLPSLRGSAPGRS